LINDKIQGGFQLPFLLSVNLFCGACIFSTLASFRYKRPGPLKADIQDLKYPVLDEMETIRKAQRDSAAFRPLYDQYFRTIYLFIFHRTGDRDVSADVTSQVFLKALMNIGKYEFRGLPFSSWLFRIAINECNSWFRKNKQTRTVLLDESHAERVYEEMFGESTADALRQQLPFILQKLKADELQLIELRFLEGRPFKEVAEILDITETHAKTKTYRTLDKMKKLFLGR
jgi:RNA polymerase sigma-70 factor (ECF subfamily)